MLSGQSMSCGLCSKLLCWCPTTYSGQWGKALSSSLWGNRQCPRFAYIEYAGCYLCFNMQDLDLKLFVRQLDRDISISHYHSRVALPDGRENTLPTAVQCWDGIDDYAAGIPQQIDLRLWLVLHCLFPVESDGVS